MGSVRRKAVKRPWSASRSGHAEGFGVGFAFAGNMAGDAVDDRFGAVEQWAAEFLLEDLLGNGDVLGSLVLTCMTRTLTSGSWRVETAPGSVGMPVQASIGRKSGA